MTTNTRNPGMPLDLDWVAGAHVNKSAVERRVATLPLRRTVKKDWQAAWLLRAVTCIDLTTLSGDDTPGRVKRLCAKARQPIRPDMLARMGLNGERITVGAVCVYPNRVADAVQALRGSDIPVASVATGFPAGQTPLPQRIGEIEQAIEAGAQRDRRGHPAQLRPDRRLGSALQRDRPVPQNLRRGCPHEDHPGYRRPGHAQAGLSGQSGGHDGRLGLHQDLHWQGSGQRHAGSQSGDGACHP